MLPLEEPPLAPWLLDTLIWWAATLNHTERCRFLGHLSWDYWFINLCASPLALDSWFPLSYSFSILQLLWNLRTALSAGNSRGMQAFDRTHCLPSILHTLPARAVLCPAWCKGEHVSCSGFRDTEKNKELLSFRCQPGDGEVGARQLQRLWANGWHHSRKPLGPHVLVNAFVKLGCSLVSRKQFQMTSLAHTTHLAWMRLLTRAPLKCVCTRLSLLSDQLVWAGALKMDPL